MNKKRPSVLFTLPDSEYQKLGLECFDEKRDATTFDFSTPVIAHPPCRLWSRLRKFSTAPKEEKELALFAIDAVRLCGGILEHPASSTLFKEYLPPAGQTDDFGGFCFSVNLNWFGFPAQKKTWLYVCGLTRSEVPAIPLQFHPVTKVIESHSHKPGRTQQLPSLQKSLRSKTPLELCKYLEKIAAKCSPTNVSPGQLLSVKGW